MQYRFISASETENLNLSFWQSSIWLSILIESNQAKEVFYFGNINSTFLLIEVRSIGFGFYGAFSLGISGIQIGEDWSIFLSELKKILADKGIVFFQMEPIDGCVEKYQMAKKGLYKKFLTPYTRTIDLVSTENEILAQMHEKWRYNIRSAMKKWVQIQKAEYSDGNLDVWNWLLNETLARDGFSGNSRKYYEVFIKNIEEKDQWWLYFAWFDWRVIAAGIFVFTTERAIYYYGASSSQTGDRNMYAPYLLQWEMMCIAKSRNIWTYDLLGISTPGIEDSLVWVTFFKSRFGWDIVELPKKIFIPISWKYLIFTSLQKIKNLLKGR